MRAAALFVAGSMLLAAPVAAAPELSFFNVCRGFTLKQTAVGLEVYCPAPASNPPKPPVPWMHFKGCLGAKATKGTANMVTITCSQGSSFLLSNGGVAI